MIGAIQPADVGPIDSRDAREQLNDLVRRLTEAVMWDVRDFWRPNGEFAAPREIPRALTLLVKGVKMHRVAPAEYAELVGMPAAEVVELKWTAQADLLLHAIEVLTGALDRQRKQGDPLSDDEVERGALQFLAARRPDLLEKYPDLFKVKP